MPIPLVAGLVLLLSILPLSAQTPAEPKPGAPDPAAAAAQEEAARNAAKEAFRKMQERISAMKPLGGHVILPGCPVSLRLGENYRFLGKEDALFVLGEVWENPKEALRGVRGIIVTSGFSPIQENAWCAVVTYDPCGYVKDDDAGKIGGPQLLEAIREHETETNERRVKQGFKPLWCVDWAEPPRYDQKRHIIFWAKRLSLVKAGTAEDTLNYDARCLGRRGLLSLNAVASMSQLPAIKQAMDDIIPQAVFDAGETYADFNADTDHVAEYTVLGLVAAGAAAKLLGKGALLVVLAKFGKLLILPLLIGWKYVLAAARWIWGRISGRKTAVPAAVAPGTSDGSAPPADPPPGV